MVLDATVRGPIRELCSSDATTCCNWRIERELFTSESWIDVCLEDLAHKPWKKPQKGALGGLGASDAWQLCQP